MDDNNSKNDPGLLIRQAKNGDVEAFNLLYEIYFTPVFRYIYLRVKDKEITNDLTQIVFLKVFQSIERYQEKNKSPLAYFFTVARNTVIDYRKKKKEIKISEPEKIFNQITDSADNPLEQLEKADTSKTLLRAISQLTDEQQEVIILKFINDLPNKEISDLFGKTEEAVRQLQCRALKSLRKYFKDNQIM